MLSPEKLWLEFKTLGVNLATGVPDSLLKDFCKFLDQSLPKSRHIIAANEGASIAIAAGSYLSNQQPALVYMQNSGLGNAINPLLSLADPKVYSIPMVLVIGWRGEPGVKDEPQHIQQGQVTPELLDAMQVDYKIVDQADNNEADLAKLAYSKCTNSSSPFVLLIRKGVFTSDNKSIDEENNKYMNRESVIEEIVKSLPENSILVSTTGHISRELYEIRKRIASTDHIDFLTVGSMGHSSQIALGIAINKPNSNVLCLDGDGAFIMHMGSIAINGILGLSNFKHIVLNNGAHGSVGGQPTVGFDINISDIAKACKYKNIFGPITSIEILREQLTSFFESKGPSLMETYVDKIARKDLGRPAESPLENRDKIMIRINQI